MKGLLKNLIGFDRNKFQLPEIIIDTNYEKIKIKSINNVKSKLDNFQLLQKKSSLLRADEEYVFKFKGFEKICRDCFLELLKLIKLEKKVKIKFLILDLETSILFRRLITWLEIKDADISCLFILDENEIQLSNYLTSNSSLFYLISINYIKKFEKLFFKEIANRKCIKFNIFIREQKIHLIKDQIKLINKLSKLIKNEIKFLNIFLPINESAILLDNSLNGLQSLINLIRPIDKKNQIDFKITDNYRKYSDQLAQLLFENNLSPSIRYLDNFNKNNKLIAELTFELLKKNYEDNKQNLIEQNCVLLIIDRSLDFITPLIHSSNYYQFVNQELEISLRAEFTLLDDQLEDATLSKIPEKLISISKKMTKEQNQTDYRKLSDLAILDQKAILLSKHIEYVNQIKIKLNNGYQHLLNIEMKLLNNEQLKCKSELKKDKIIDKKEQFLDDLINLDQKEFIICLKRLLGNEINQLDWKRILCIYSILKEKLDNNTIKIIKDKITKDMEKELEKIVDLFKKLEQKNQTKLITLKNLINLIQNNELDEIKYPTVNYLTQTNPTKLLIFISGGLSFNELNLVKTNLDTILISDAILYPRKFIRNLI